jgi:hypothetical protein
MASAEARDLFLRIVDNGLRDYFRYLTEREWQHVRSAFERFLYTVYYVNKRYYHLAPSNHAPCWCGGIWCVERKHTLVLSIGDVHCMLLSIYRAKTHTKKGMTLCYLHYQDTLTYPELSNVNTFIDRVVNDCVVGLRGYFVHAPVEWISAQAEAYQYLSVTPCYFSSTFERVHMVSGSMRDCRCRDLSCHAGKAMTQLTDVVDDLLDMLRRKGFRPKAWEL